MRFNLKTLMTVLTAAVILSLAASTSLASRSIEISGETTLTLNGPVTFEARFSGITGQIICNTTFTKTISRVIPKVEGALVGRVTRVEIDRPERCRLVNISSVNSITVLNVQSAELWRIFYKQFLGVLPDISGLLFILRHVQLLVLFRRPLEPNLSACLYENGRREQSVGVLATVERRIIGRLRTLDEQTAPREFDLVEALPELRGVCPETARFKAALTPLQTTTIFLL